MTEKVKNYFIFFCFLLVAARCPRLGLGIDLGFALLLDFIEYPGMFFSLLTI